MSPRPPRKAIEEGFPIVEINRLAKPERNAFKPIYQMHKWFARRASCVFRAILLGAMKPAGADIMEEFYKDHSHDPDTNGVHILDPFMGGGTTIVEALRLGCRVTGIDLNPVAWFIVKSEVEPVDLEDLKAAFERLAARPTASGKSLREDLLEQYKTECPCCGAGREEADIIYTFWVKSVTCTSPTCRQTVPLFGSYVIAAKSPSVRYVPDFECANCKKTFDLEIDSVAVVPESSLMAYNARDGAGDKRGAKRWAVADFHNQTLVCPWCSAAGETPRDTRAFVIEKKKIALTVLLCPHCWAVWQYRGTLHEQVTCPVCAGTYDPMKGNIPAKGKFECPSCGTRDNIINAIRKLPDDQLLQTAPYAIEGYCPECAGRPENDSLFEDMNRGRKAPDHACNLFRNNGKFFKKTTPGDLKRYQEAEARWERENESLPYPKGEIPVGEKTKSGLLAHHYRYWHQMFNPRQLLCLSTLLKGIDEEKDQVLKEMLLSAFFNLLNNMSDLCSYIWQRDCIRQIFARHDFQPKATICESNVWGATVGMGTFVALFEAVLKGKSFNHKPFDRLLGDSNHRFLESNETIKGNGRNCHLECKDSGKLMINLNLPLIITDPPYAGNVNYSELADFFYVWLRLVLGKTYPHFAPEITPKADEIIENPTRGKTAEDYRTGLTSVWAKCHESLEEQGLLVFTFHHAEGSTWETLLDSLCQAGFAIEAIYPIHSESESSLHLMDKDSIS
ncbi:MAG: putative methylase, partial [Thermodesulfobacteriota bacterium]|nr:putative methylase [Thermodesulfobacteriota bacterium]